MWENLELIRLAEIRSHWQHRDNTVMKLCVPYDA